MTTVSKPIEKLIQDIEQERAKEYWERIKRFKDQAEEQKNWREAHEQRQLELMRSAGIDLKKFEKNQEQDTEYMKSYLEQKRSALISRPAQPPQSPPPNPLFLGGKDFAPIGTGVFKPPPTGVSISDPAQLKIMVTEDGSGSGFSLAAEAYAATPWDVLFLFTPTQDASYTFTASLEFHGFYFLQADDTAFTSKWAEVQVSVELTAYQAVNRPNKTFPYVVNSGIQPNINEFDNINTTLYFTDTQDFHADVPVVIIVTIKLLAAARGDGSHAEVNFQDGANSYIQPGLWVSPAP